MWVVAKGFQLGTAERKRQHEEVIKPARAGCTSASRLIARIDIHGLAPTFTLEVSRRRPAVITSQAVTAATSCDSRRL